MVSAKKFLQMRLTQSKLARTYTHILQFLCTRCWCWCLFPYHSAFIDKRVTLRIFLIHFIHEEIQFWTMHRHQHPVLCHYAYCVPSFQCFLLRFSTQSPTLCIKFDVKWEVQLSSKTQIFFPALAKAIHWNKLKEPVYVVK